MACRIFLKVTLYLFFHVGCKWVLSEPLCHHYSVMSLLHHTEICSDLDFVFSFILSSEAFHMYWWYSSFLNIWTLWSVYIGEILWSNHIVKDDGCICLYSIFHLHSFEGEIHFSCCSVLYPFHLLLCGYSDFSYLATFPKCIECKEIVT